MQENAGSLQVVYLPFPYFTRILILKYAHRHTCIYELFVIPLGYDQVHQVVVYTAPFRMEFGSKVIQEEILSEVQVLLAFFGSSQETEYISPRRNW